MSLPMPAKSAYVCDTLPAAKLAGPGVANVHDHYPIVNAPPPNPPGPSIQKAVPKAPPHPPVRKLCVRHQRMADEGTNLKLQQVRMYRSHDQVQTAHPGPCLSPWTHFQSKRGRRSIAYGPISRHHRTADGPSSFMACSPCAVSRSCRFSQSSWPI
jgi:hypothetical protein